MKAIRTLVLAAALSAGTIVVAAPAASAVEPTNPVAAVQQRVDDKVKHITAHLAQMRTKIAANARFTPAQKAQLLAGMNAVEAAALAAQREIRLDKTMAEINADRPLLTALREKRAKLREDLAAARAAS